MAETTFTLSLQIDGADVKRQAAAIRKHFEAAMKAGGGGARGRAGIQIDVAKAKAALKIQDRQNRLLIEAQKLARESGLAWDSVQENMNATGASLATVVGQLKRYKAEQASINKQQQITIKATAQLRKQVLALGIPWADVERAIDESGLSLTDMQGVLQRVNREMSQTGRAASAWDAAFDSLEAQAIGLGKAISDARNEYQGITQLAGDFQAAGQTLQQTGAAVTGTLALAGREYINFTNTSAVAARTMGLNAEMTETFNGLLLEMSGNLGAADASELAAGAVTWAKAVGQTAESEEELRAIIAQTIPAQKVAALSQENLTMLLEGGATAMRQFGLETTDMERILAVVTRAADVTVAEISGLNEGLKFIGPTAKEFGVSLEDTVATLGLLAEMGIQGSMAGTGIARALSDVVSPSTKAAAEFENLFDAAQPFFEGGEFIGLPAMIDKLAAALEDMSSEQRAAALNTIFDANAVRALTPLIASQIEARKHGVNQLRAFSKNMQGVRDAEVDAWAEMRLQTEGIAVDTTGAIEAVRNQWNSYQESDQRRVDLARARWQQLWLTIGGQGVQMALPALDRAAKILTDITRIADAHPEIVGLVGKAAIAALAGGTLLNLVGSVARSAVAVKSIMAGVQAWGLKRQTAEAQAATTITSAAETFRAIVVASANEAAGIETAGAVEETEIEKASAGGAGMMGALVSAAALIAAGVAATGALVHIVNSVLDKSGLGAKIAEAQETIRATGRFYPGVPGLGGPAPPTAEIVPAQRATQEIQDVWNDAGIGVARMAREAAGDLVNLAGGLEQVSAAAKEAAGFTDEQKKAADIYADLLKRQADAVSDFNDRLADATRDLNNDLAKLADDYSKSQRQSRKEFDAEQGKSAREFRERQTREAAEHQKRLARMEEDHNMKMWSLSVSRDAAGLILESRRYSVEKNRAVEDFQDTQSQEGDDFAQERAEAVAQQATRMEDNRVQYEERRAARLADYQVAVAEMQAEHTADMARLKQEYFDKLNAELEYYALSEAQQNTYYQVMLADARGFLDNNRNLWLNYVRSLPVPGGSSREELRNLLPGGSFQSGGPVENTGLAMVHAGEFVMSAATTRQVEASRGGRLTQGSAAGGGINIPLTINGMGMDPGQVARIAGQQVERKLRRVLEDTGRGY